MTATNHQRVDRSTSGSDRSWREPWRTAVDRTQADYGTHVGASIDDIVTPALVIDRPALLRNLQKMAASAAANGVALRPHAKVQKAPQLSRLQAEFGAVGATVATVWEAAAVMAAGVPDVLIANEVVGPAKLSAAAALARHGRLALVIDNADNLADIDRACQLADSHMDVLIDVDVGMGRCGIRSTGEAVALAQRLTDSRCLHLHGIQAYEGHCMLEPDRARRVRLANAAMDRAADVLAVMHAYAEDAVVVSGGGTGTFDISPRHGALTELQAGSYVFMDDFHRGLVDGFEVSLTVASTVTARHGQTVVLDAGRKSIGIDFCSPPLEGSDKPARYFAEEHAIFDVGASRDLRAGDRAYLTPGYAPTTVNLHDVMFVAENGKVTEVWPVFPRGPGNHGFMRSLFS